MIKDISSRKINVSINDKTFEESYLNLDVTIDYEAFENEVLAYGKDMSFLKKVKAIKEPESRTYEFNILYSDEKISEFLDSINEQVLVNPRDAEVTISYGTVNIISDQIGYELNKDDLKPKIETALENVKGEEIVLLDGELKEVQPYITAGALESVDTKISSYTTHFSPGPSGTNIKVGAGMIGSRIVMPGDQFSAVEAIGPTTAEYGFVSANTYLNGELV